MRHTSRLGRLLHICYLMFVVATVTSLAYVWGLSCEGFACTGVGIVWMAWAGVLLLPTLVSGTVLAVRSGARDRLPTFTRWLHGGMLVLNLWLLAYWLHFRFV